MKSLKLVLLPAVVLGSLLLVQPATAAIGSTTDASAIARAMAEKPFQVIGAEFVGQQTTATPGPAGVGTGSLAGFPTAGADFGVLTTGNAESGNTTTQGSVASRSNGVGPPVLERGTKAFDYVVLKIDVQIPVGANCASADLRFMSEEYPTYINAGYNDSFLIEVDKSDWTATASGLNAPNDVAASSGQRITVDTLGVSGFTASSAAGTIYNGGSPMLQARFRVTPGRHQIYMSVLDQGDPVLDSAAFVDNLRFTNEPAGSCSFQGQGDNTPASLITCGPLGTMLTPCEGLLPKPPKLTVCGPEYGTILKSCKGLGLGMGPAPFIGGDVWDDLLVKCPDLGNTCSADIDAYLEGRGNASFGSTKGVKTGKKARRALATLSADLAKNARKSFEVARILDGLTTAAPKGKKSKRQASTAMFNLGSYFNGVFSQKVLDGLGFVGVSNALLGATTDAQSSVNSALLSDSIAQAFQGLNLPKMTSTIDLMPAGQHVKGRGGWLGGALKDLDKTTAGIFSSINALNAQAANPGTSALLNDMNALMGQLSGMLTTMKSSAAVWDDAGTSGKWDSDARKFADGQAGSLSGILQRVSALGSANGQLSGLTGLMLPNAGVVAPTMQKLSESLNMFGAQTGMIAAESNSVAQVIRHANSEGEKGSFGQLDVSTALAGRGAGWFMPFQDSINTLSSSSSAITDQVTDGDLASTNDLIAFGSMSLSGISAAKMLDALGLTADEAMDAKEPIKDPLLQNIDPGNEVVIAKRGRQLSLGSASAVIKQGRTATLKLGVTRQAKLALKNARKSKKGRKVVVKLVVTVRNASGKAVTKTFRVKVGNGKQNRRR